MFRSQRFCSIFIFEISNSSSNFAIIVKLFKSSNFIDIHDVFNVFAFVNINKNDNFANIHNVVDDYNIANFKIAFCFV